MLDPKVLRILIPSLGLLLAATPGRARAGYVATPVGGLGGPDTLGYALNNAGEVVGAASPGGSTPSRPFLWDGAAARDLDPAFALGGAALAIGETGHVAGYVLGSRFGNPLAMLDGAVIPDLGAVGRATGVNAEGLAVGEALNPDSGLTQPFLARSNTYPNGMKGVQVAFLSGADGKPVLGGAVGINDAGQVAGTLDNGHAFLFSPGPGAFGQGFVADIGALPQLKGDLSTAVAIDARGEVIGTFNDGTATRGFLFDGGSLSVLPFLPTAINDAGQVVGSSLDAATWKTTFWLASGGQEIDLSGTSLGDGYRITGLVGINDVGQILAEGSRLDPGAPSGEDRDAFLLTPERSASLLAVRPIPEPSGLVLLLLGGPILLAAARRRAFRPT